MALSHLILLVLIHSARSFTVHSQLSRRGSTRSRPSIIPARAISFPVVVQHRFHTKAMLSFNLGFPVVAIVCPLLVLAAVFKSFKKRNFATQQSKTVFRGKVVWLVRSQIFRFDAARLFTRFNLHADWCKLWDRKSSCSCVRRGWGEACTTLRVLDSSFLG